TEEPAAGPRGPSETCACRSRIEVRREADELAVAGPDDVVAAVVRGELRLRQPVLARAVQVEIAVEGVELLVAPRFPVAVHGGEGEVVVGAPPRIDLASQAHRPERPRRPRDCEPSVV